MSFFEKGVQWFDDKYSNNYVGWPLMNWLNKNDDEKPRIAQVLIAQVLAAEHVHRILMKEMKEQDLYFDFEGKRRMDVEFEFLVNRAINEFSESEPFVSVESIQRLGKIICPELDLRGVDAYDIGILDKVLCQYLLNLYERIASDNSRRLSKFSDGLGKFALSLEHQLLLKELMWEIGRTNPKHHTEVAKQYEGCDYRLDFKYSEGEEQHSIRLSKDVFRTTVSYLLILIKGRYFVHSSSLSEESGEEVWKEETFIRWDPRRYQDYVVDDEPGMIEANNVVAEIIEAIKRKRSIKSYGDNEFVV